MSTKIEINQGEVKVDISEYQKGNLTFEELGLTNENLVFEGGLLRIVFVIKDLDQQHYFHTPTIEVAYKEEMAETHWQCDYNEEIILDKYDHHGHSTVMLLNRKKLEALEHRHENTLILHAEFPEAVHLEAGKSYIHFF